MKIPQHNPSININGSHFQANLNLRDVHYSVLKKIFGKPDHEDMTDGYKVSTEWKLAFEDGTIATIYDWKATSLYDDPDAPSPDMLRADNTFWDWHVGGFNKQAVENVINAINSYEAKSLTPEEKEDFNNLVFMFKNLQQAVDNLIEGKRDQTLIYCLQRLDNTNSVTKQMFEKMIDERNHRLK